jgi:3-hydroxyisobutyrate dehydrogenase
MATNLLKAGHDVIVYDLNPRAIEQLLAAGAKSADSAATAASNAEVIITMLPNGAVVRRLYEGDDGIITAVRTSDSLLIDCSTISPEDARAVARAAQSAGLEMADAPVSGGVRGAREATLSFMVGASSEGFSRAKSVLSAMGSAIYHVGDNGAGQAAKICNNLMAGILMAGTAEVLALGARNGLPPEILSEIMRHSSGGNFMLERWNPWPGVDEGTPASNAYAGGFQVSLLLKDLGLALDSAQASRAAAPLGALTCHLFRLHALLADGADKLDMSSIQRLYFPEPPVSSVS